MIKVKDILISINNSSESLEKTIGLIYTNIIFNYNFYNNFEVYIFYGNNLPKQNKELTVSGTLGFYDKYFQNYNLNYPVNINDLWLDKINILQKLISNGKLSPRRADKMSYDMCLFSKLMKNIPITYLYPDFYERYMSLIGKQCSNIHFVMINLYDTYMKIFEELKQNNLLYKIYALTNDGDIGVFNLDIPKNDFYERNKLHLLKSLKKSVALSGNSAIFLRQIEQEIRKKSFCTIGYRNHKISRIARDDAMKYILENYPNALIEPKNVLYNSYFDEFAGQIYGEELANQVVLKVYLDFLNNNYDSLKIGIKK